MMMNLPQIDDNTLKMMSTIGANKNSCLAKENSLRRLRYSIGMLELLVVH